MRSRQVTQHSENGGKGCQGGLAEISECGRNKCEQHLPVDCKHGDWLDWGACTKCSGERKRLRKIVRYAEHGGENCESLDTEEVAQCPRKCHESLFCVWERWQDWGDCSTTCGSGGKRKRRRYLHLTRDAKNGELPSMEEFIEKSELFQKRTLDLESRHLQELMLSFIGGCVSLMIMLAGIRVGSFLRRTLSRDLVSTHNANRDLHLREMLEANYPLVASEALTADVETNVE